MSGEENSSLLDLSKTVDNASYKEDKEEEKEEENRKRLFQFGYACNQPKDAAARRFRAVRTDQAQCERRRIRFCSLRSKRWCALLCPFSLLPCSCWLLFQIFAPLARPVWRTCLRGLFCAQSSPDSQYNELSSVREENHKMLKQIGAACQDMRHRQKRTEFYTDNFGQQNIKTLVI